MKEILPDLDLWQSQGEDIALATVVRVRRSAPRPPGARLCITRSGRMSGSVSGGCVEADVFERAMQVLDTRKPEVANYGIADELGFEVGLSCGGSIDVLIEPFVVDAEWDSLRRSCRTRAGGCLRDRPCPGVRAWTQAGQAGCQPVHRLYSSFPGQPHIRRGRKAPASRRNENSLPALRRGTGSGLHGGVSPVAQPADRRGNSHCDVSLPTGRSRSVSRSPS